MTTSQMNERETWETYAKSWKVPTPGEKRALYEAALSPTCTYTDPLHIARGWDELEAYMLEFHQQIPGGHFVTDTFLTHHGRGIAHWRMLDGDGVEQGTGTSYCEFGGDGKLIAMTGFFQAPDA